MKKNISFLLGCVLIACFFCGCNTDHDKADNPATETVESVNEVNPNNLMLKDPDGTIEVAESSVTEPIATEPIVTEPEYFTNDYGTFRRVNETVMTEGDVFLRSAPNGKRVVNVDKDVILTRTGIGEENGWSLVQYNGEDVYVASYYVYPTDEPTYIEVNDVVVAKEEANLRVAPSINSKARGKIALGGELIRIAIGDDGWSRVLYKGSEAYIYSLYVEPKVKNVETTPVETEAIVDETTAENFEESVPTTVPEETEPQEEIPIKELTHFEKDGVVYEVVDEIVEAARTVNVRSGPDTTYDKVGKVAGGKTLQRIAVGENGWSIVIFKGEEAYIYSEYLLRKR